MNMRERLLAFKHRKCRWPDMCEECWQGFIGKQADLMTKFLEALGNNDEPNQRTGEQSDV